MANSYVRGIAGTSGQKECWKKERQSHEPDEEEAGWTIQSKGNSQIKECRLKVMGLVIRASYKEA